MKVRLEPEPCYDTPRVSNFANEIEASLNKIIADCESAGYITPATPSSAPHAAPRADLKGAKA